MPTLTPPNEWSLSVRRAWIEIVYRLSLSVRAMVALREESVD